MLGLVCWATSSARAFGLDVADGTLPLPGDRGIALTALQGTTVEEIPVVFLGTYENFGGPGFDLHLVRLQGPIAEHVGVASGMSGSPVIFEGRLLGALAYRLGGLPKDPVAGVTPIGQVLAAAAVGSPPTRPTQAGLELIGTPIVASATLPAVREWLSTCLNKRGYSLEVSGGSGTTLPQAELAPGSPVGVELMRGDVRIAATGTVTWIDGDRVFAFGHPFLGGGRTSMPMVHAEVIHTLADLSGSFKLTKLGREFGAVVEDRLTAIVGQRGARARMIPMRVEVRGGDYGVQRFGFELIDAAQLSPILAATGVAQALLLNLGASREATLIGEGEVRLKDLPPIRFGSAFAGEDSPAAGLSLASDVLGLLDAIWANPFGPAQVESLSWEIAATSDLRRYRLEGVHFDRSPLRSGDRLQVSCNLRALRGGVLRKEIELRLPGDLPSGTVVTLAVGAPDAVERALGQPLRQRLQTARDLGAFSDALGSARGANHLEAVLFEPGRAVVSRGLALGSLPPSAERLLGATDPGAPRRARDGGVLDARAVPFDGPVEGLQLFRIRLDGGTFRLLPTGSPPTETPGLSPVRDSFRAPSRESSR